MVFLYQYFQEYQTYSQNFPFYFCVFILTLIFTVFRTIDYRVRATGLTLITFLFGVLDLFSTGLSGDGRIFLIAAPVLALLLLGTIASEIVTLLSLLTYIIAGFTPYLDFVPIRFIPVEDAVSEYTWITSGIIFATILIGLVVLVWKFATLNYRTSMQNSLLTDESKSLRDLTEDLQAREMELQALLKAIGDKVRVIDNQGRILKTTEGHNRTAETIADSHRKNILRILPQPQASDVLEQINDALQFNQTRVIDYCVEEGGQERWYSGTISPFEDDKVVMVSRDITDSITSSSRERDQRTLANALKNAASLVNSPLDIDEVLIQVLAAVGEVIAVDVSSIILIGDRGRLSGVGRSGLPGFQKNMEALSNMTINDFQTLRTMKRTGNALVIPDIALYPAWAPLAGDTKTHSYLGCPINIKGKAAGFLSLESVKPGFYTPEHIDKLQSFVDLAATAIENAHLQQETQKMAISDELTALYNRRGLMDIGRREIDRARRFDHPLSVAIMDLDNFKSINDTYGHIAGDQLLNQVADACRAGFREIDIIARYGGDEIVVLLIENNLDQAYQIANRFRESIASRVFRTDVGNLTTTVSIGVAELGKNMDNLTELIDTADRALYMAKEAGRNRIMTV
jgi:diguanylate cyclase (GGDEF)-like protein